jgi:hypothetical protein
MASSQNLNDFSYSYLTLFPIKSIEAISSFLDTPQLAAVGLFIVEAPCKTCEWRLECFNAPTIESHC